MIAEFKLWKPEGLDKPKAILVLTPGSNSDGRDDVNDPFWRKFAKENDLAIVGCFFQDDEPSGIEVYCDQIASDSGLTLISFLTDEFGKRSIPPILLWGFSAGGQFNYEFACAYPGWVAGFVVNKGGIYYTALAPEETRRIPAMWFVGENDAKFRRDIIHGIYGLNRMAGANWRIYSEVLGHAIGASKLLGVEFFKNILKEMR